MDIARYSELSWTLGQIDQDDWPRSEQGASYCDGRDMTRCLVEQGNYSKAEVFGVQQHGYTYSDHTRDYLT